MKPANKFALVLVTAPDLKTARRLARLALEDRLIACANIIPRLESHYWWEEKIEKASETLLLLKTTSAKLTALERLVLHEHPYQTPEFIVLSLRSGTAKYLDWITSSTRP